MVGRPLHIIITDDPALIFQPFDRLDLTAVELQADTRTASIFRDKDDAGGFESALHLVSGISMHPAALVFVARQGGSRHVRHFRQIADTDLKRGPSHSHLGRRQVITLC